MLLFHILTNFGGATRYAWDMAEFLSDQGDDVTMVSMYADRNHYPENQITKLDISNKANLTQSIKFWINLSKIRRDLYNLIQKEKPDVVFI